LYATKPFSLSFPELDTHSPHELFTTALLYRILISQRRQEKLLAGLKTAHTVSPGYAATLQQEIERLHGREAYFWGMGDIYKRMKKRFAATRARCVLVDVEHGALPDSVDGIPVRHPKDVLPSGDILPIVVFAQNINAIYKTIREQYPAFTDLVFVPY